MHFPDYLKPFRLEAEKLLDDGMVKEIEFSGGTYQVQVYDPKLKKDAWAFLQLDPRGYLKDCFCSCEEESDVSACVHLAAAYLRIFNQQASPLHQRFERSLWNQLCLLYANRVGYETQTLKHPAKGLYSISSIGGKKVFFLKAKTSNAINHLKEMIEHRHKETEETSLKFSNLPQEEIILWKEGRPSPHLRYELSFWNDLAKWLMFFQDSGQEYKINFEYSDKRIPNSILISFHDVELSFYLSEANLPLIIPALSTVNSPLAVHDPEKEALEKITYDKKEGCLNIHLKRHIELRKNDYEPAHSKLGYPLGNWYFIKGDGFYTRDQHKLLRNKRLCGRQISQALNEHFSLIKNLLEGYKVHEDPLHASYSVDFDSEWNLHITCYAFTPGDLTTSDSKYFGEWIYLDDDGFYRLEGILFEEGETVIPTQEVADFVHKHRVWLNTIEGFQTHLVSVEAQLTYNLSPDNKLTFSRRLAITDSIKNKDFGPWVYVVGEGFYSKVSSSIGLPLRPGISINADQIPLFIRMNQEELQLVPNFFSEKCPVVKTGLIIKLEDDEVIQILPEYVLLPEYQNAFIRYFEDFVFIEGEGFHELPVDSRLPEQFRHPVNIDKENLPLFLNYQLENLKPFATSIDPRLLKPETLHLTAAHISKAEEHEKGWYALKLNYQSERGLIPIASLWAAFKQKKRFFFSEAGLIDLEEKRFDWLRVLAKNRIDRRSNTLFLSTLELIRLNAFDEIEVSKEKRKEHQQSIEILKELTEFRIPEEPNVAGLSSQLRPYQQVGLRWLWFLYHHGLSGLLCDDMGLGKTHQAMALLASVINHIHKDQEKGKHYFLIVCPTSVIFHWQEKLAAFLPNMRVCLFHGGKRNLGEFKKDYDILLTSYGIWRIEHEILSKVFFEIAIFDEIQVAKNAQSRVHSSLLAVDAKMRIGLTGTPIENHLRELKSLFDLVLPSYMPGETDYREFFVKPIEKEQDRKRRELLSRFIKPFVMRRKKEDVLLDLPEKTEEVSHCILLPDQEKLYIEVLEMSRQKILDELSNESSPIPYMHIFAVLSNLKQICNHPSVYLKDPQQYKNFQSGKWDLFLELLSEARESEQKVVIFSQYLMMLDIIEEYLNEAGIGFASIRGSTINRGEQIQRFNQDPGCEVFVASLQAAGLGIDLTAASVVIHYDRWWNAARENQATDRVHRIGQKRGVQVFKLVTKGTFEEKIDELISRKGKLMEEVVGVDDHQIVKQFDRKEIIQLLQYVPASSFQLEE